MNAKKLTLSGIVMACYVIIMYFTAGFSFGAYQIRIATAIYGLAYLFPFLVLPLGLSNLLSNMLLGGLGFFDIIGGGAVGLLTAGTCALLGRHHRSEWWIILPITLIPGLGVAAWLSYLLKMPYPVLALSLCIGQFLPAVFGAILAKTLRKFSVPYFKDYPRNGDSL